jgi:hypothetical protein
MVGKLLEAGDECKYLSDTVPGVVEGRVAQISLDGLEVGELEDEGG